MEIMGKALENAAFILANFKACTAENDGTLERKLEEWQACYAKLFTQMVELFSYRDANFARFNEEWDKVVNTNDAPDNPYKWALWGYMTAHKRDL